MGWFRSSNEQDAASLRERMVEDQVAARGVRDERVLRALRAVPRHLFLLEEDLRTAYSDRALPIGHGQTISQPYIVGSMTAALEPEPGLRVLEIGTGSGYQAAVLAACGLEVFSVERIPELHGRARAALERTGLLDRVRLRLGDGSRGWPEEAPFDRILLTAAPERVPKPLRKQLRPGGILVAPVGEGIQTIYRDRKTESGEWVRERREGARFVPLVRDPEGPEDGDEGEPSR